MRHSQKGFLLDLLLAVLHLLEGYLRSGVYHQLAVATITHKMHTFQKMNSNDKQTSKSPIFILSQTKINLPTQVSSILPPTAYYVHAQVPCQVMMNNNYYIDGRIQLNLPKSIQSTIGLKGLKSAANGCYLTCKSYYLHLLYRSTFILL